MTNELVVRAETRWLQGGDWMVDARDAEGDLLIRIDDRDLSHLVASATHGLEGDEAEQALAAELARVAARNKPVVGAQGRRLDIYLR